MSTTFDLAPLWRFGIGFDHMLDALGQAMNRENPAKYPPYNIEQTGDDAYRLTLALAGWSPNEVTVTTEPNLLAISGEKAAPEGKQYLYRGISWDAFERRFNLADYVQVRDARMADGVLVIDLVREVPEALKPRRIEIANSNTPPALEHQQAAAA
jgi:molecular chaperone IbpA